MSGGLDTRTAVDGFMRGMQAGNGLFDARDKRQKNKEDREWTKKSRDRQAGEWAKKDDVEQIQGYYTRLANKDQLSQGDIEKFGQLQEAYPQYKLGRFLDPNAKKNISAFKDVFNPETSTNLKSPETLQAATAVLDPWLNKNTTDGQRKVVSMIAPGKTKGTVVMGVNVIDKSGKVISEHKPITVGRRNSEQDPEGKDQVLEVPVEQLIKHFRGYEMMSSIQDDPEISNHARTIAMQNGWISGQDKKYSTVNTGEGVFAVNDSNPNDRHRIGSSIQKGGSGTGRGASNSNNIASVTDDYFKAKQKLRSDGLAEDDSFKELRKDFVTQYGFDPESVVEMTRQNLRNNGISREPTKDEVLQVSTKLFQKQQAKLSLPEQNQSPVEQPQATTQVPKRIGLSNNQIQKAGEDQFSQLAMLERQLSSGSTGGRPLHQNKRQQIKAKIQEIKSQLPSREEAPMHLEKIDRQLAMLESNGGNNEAAVVKLNAYKDAILKYVLARQQGLQMANNANYL